MLPPDSASSSADGSNLAGESTLDQSGRIAGVNTPLGKDVLALRGVSIAESLGGLPSFSLDLISEQDTIDADSLLGKPMSVWLNVVGGKRRYFQGYVIQFGRSNATSRYFAYEATVAPWLWFLTRTRNCRIFQNQSVRDIIETVFKEHGYPYKPRLTGEYTSWEYCVQYRESDFDFVSRLMEQEGIYYYFEYEEDQNTLILADSPGAHDPMPGYETISYRPPEAVGAEEDVAEHVREFVREVNHQPGTYTHTDYNFETPSADLRASSSSPGDYPVSHLEVYDYPGEYEKHHEGDDWARTRMAEITAQGELFSGWGDTRGLAAGCAFDLSEPPDPDLAGKYLVTSASHRISSGQYESGPSAGDDVYKVHFVVQPASRTFRPTRDTAKPHIRGLQTAIVTGPKGEEIYTDKYGRIKVQFHWDREGKYDENTTCFVRVASLWAGRRWGATFTPRIGQEVVVAFLEGDPDEPLVIGSVYNGQQMPPYLGDGPDPEHPNDKNLSGIKSCSTKGGQGYNEWRFNDTKGKEQIYIHAEKDIDTRVKNDTRTTVGDSTHLTVGYKDAAGELHGFIKEKVFRTKETHALKSILEFADEFNARFVGTNGEYKEIIRSDGSFAAQAKNLFSVNAGSVLIEAGPEGQISLKCGASFIVLKPDGIYINGPMVYVNSGGEATSAVTLETTTPDEPDAADDAKGGSVSAASSQTPAPTPSASSNGAPAAAKPAMHRGDTPNSFFAGQGDDSTAASLPGNGPFSTKDDAARAALDDSNPQSIHDNREYAGLIYKGTDDQYYYTHPAAGNGDTSQPYDSPAPPDATVVGNYHCHGDYSSADANGKPVRTSDPAADRWGSDDFSSADKSEYSTMAKNQPGYTGYLGTPSGTFRKYDPATGDNTKL